MAAETRSQGISSYCIDAAWDAQSHERLIALSQMIFSGKFIVMV